MAVGWRQHTLERIDRQGRPAPQRFHLLRAGAFTLGLVEERGKAFYARVASLHPGGADRFASLDEARAFVMAQTLPLLAAPLNSAGA